MREFTLSTLLKIWICLVLMAGPVVFVIKYGEKWVNAKEESRSHVIIDTSSNVVTLTLPVTDTNTVIMMPMTPEEAEYWVRFTRRSVCHE